MPPISYRYCHFPPEIVQHTVWLYARFTLSFRDVEELLAERGIQVSYESIRRWVARFGPQIARRLRYHRPRPHSLWHLDEVFVSMNGQRSYLWRAIDQNGEILDILVQAKRDKKAALKLMRKLMNMALAQVSTEQKRERGGFLLPARGVSMLEIAPR